MPYDQLDIKINKYLENRMTTIEQEHFESDLKSNSHLENEFNGMKNVFELLDSQVLIHPPSNLVTNILKITEKPKSSNKVINRILAQSLIAAGFYITLFDQYTLLRILHDFSSYLSNALFYLNNFL